MNQQAQQLIEDLDLAPHPEGGFYREEFRSEKMLESSDDGFPQGRCASTLIYFLIPEGVRTKLHRIKSDEHWLYLNGDPTKVRCFTPEGKMRSFVVGNPLEHSTDLSFHKVAYAGEWFGAECVNNTHGFSLLGLFVAPGFEFKDLEMAEKAQLLEDYPAYEKDIIRFFE